MSGAGLDPSDEERNEALLRWAAQEALVEKIARIAEFDPSTVLLLAPAEEGGRQEAVKLSWLRETGVSAAMRLRAAMLETARALAANFKRIAMERHGVMAAEFRQARADYAAYARRLRAGGEENGDEESGQDAA